MELGYEEIRIPTTCLQIEKFLNRTSRYSAELLFRHYNEGYRKYHNLGHIIYMLKNLKKIHNSAFGHNKLLVLAILYHDYIYDPNRQDNELASANAFAEIHRMSLNCQEIDYVKRLIVESVDPVLSVEFDLQTDLSLMHDLDFLILGEQRIKYLEYSYNLHDEYSCSYSFKDYVRGRIAFLKKMLEKERIFCNKLFEKYEERAKGNIKHELSFLEGK